MAEIKLLQQSDDHYRDECRHNGESAHQHFLQNEMRASEVVDAAERNLNLLRAHEKLTHDTSTLREEDREQVRRCSEWVQNEVTAHHDEMNYVKSQSVDRQYANELAAKQKAEVEWHFEQREQVRMQAEANVVNNLRYEMRATESIAKETKMQCHNDASKVSEAYTQAQSQ